MCSWREESPEQTGSMGNDFGEAVSKWLEVDVLGFVGEGIDLYWLSEHLADELEVQPAYLREAIERRVREWHHEHQKS